MGFYSKLLELCAKEGTNPSAVANKIGASNATASGWKKGSKPSDVNLVRIAALFNVPVSFFDDSQGEPQDEYDEFLELLKSDPDSRAILKSYGSSNKEDRARITRMVKALKGKEDD